MLSDDDIKKLLEFFGPAASHEKSTMSPEKNIITFSKPGWILQLVFDELEISEKTWTTSVSVELLPSDAVELKRATE